MKLKEKQKGLNSKSNSEGLRKRAGVKCSSPVDMLPSFKYRRCTQLLSRASLYYSEYGKGNENISARQCAPQSQTHMIHHAENSAVDMKTTRKNKSFSIKEIK